MRATHTRSENGFTLIEIVASLAILGIIGALVGAGMVTSFESYVFAKENVGMNQRARVAMKRLVAEMIRVDTIDTANSDRDELVYTSVSRDPRFTYTLTRESNELRLKVRRNANRTLTYTLAPNITGYGNQEHLFTYRQSDGTLWVPGSDPYEDLYAVDVLLMVARPKDHMSINNLRFTTTINPRNNGLLNAPGPKS